MTNHLQESKDKLKYLESTDRIVLRGNPADSEDIAIVSHALIAIAEQLGDKQVADQEVLRDGIMHIFGISEEEGEDCMNPSTLNDMLNRIHKQANLLLSEFPPEEDK